MSNLLFEHESLGTMTIGINPDDIAWSYNLNTANFPTYGGEVIQILSIYIDDLYLTGMVRTYDDLERIYKYFAEYISIASQGESGHGEYNQIPMRMTYLPRNWTFIIQPLKIPAFKYSRDTVAPKWQLQAHVVDETAGNYEELKQMIEVETLSGLHGEGVEPFKLKGIISPLSGDPENNPFSAPGTKFGEKFSTTTDYRGKTESLNELAVHANTLLNSYISGDYSSITQDIGSRPAFGLSLNEEGAKSAINQAEATAEKEAKEHTKEVK